MLPARGRVARFVTPRVESAVHGSVAMGLAERALRARSGLPTMADDVTAHPSSGRTGRPMRRSYAHSASHGAALIPTDASDPLPSPDCARPLARSIDDGLAEPRARHPGWFAPAYTPRSVGPTRPLPDLSAWIPVAGCHPSPPPVATAWAWCGT